MKMKLKRLNKENPVPSYETEKSVGMDCFVSEETVISPGEVKLVPLGVCAEAPEGTMIGLLVRSSTPMKTTLMLANSMGVIDQDYAGNGDEIHALVYNYGEEPVKLAEGDRRFQMVVFDVTTVEVEEVEDMENADRGGFGSTGD